METEGDNFALLTDNDYDTFSPLSEEVTERLLAVDGWIRRNHTRLSADTCIRNIRKKVSARW